MIEARPRVLWIDEDQGMWSRVKWMIARCGAVVEPAFTVEQGLQALSAAGAADPPDVVLLDLIVRSSLHERSRERYSGLQVWNALSDDLKKRTLILSVVPYELLQEETEQAAARGLLLEGGAGRVLAQARGAPPCHSFRGGRIMNHSGMLLASLWDFYWSDLRWFDWGLLFATALAALLWLGVVVGEVLSGQAWVIRRLYTDLGDYIRSTSQQTTSAQRSDIDRYEFDLGTFPFTGPDWQATLLRILQEASALQAGGGATTRLRELICKRLGDLVRRTASLPNVTPKQRLDLIDEIWKAVAKYPP